MKGAKGLKIIVIGYMPWFFGKTPYTYITHNLRFFGFFDKYQCMYIFVKLGVFD
jgi:hypothetical protein